MKNFFFILVFFYSFSTFAQTKKVLFIGNSYTNYNNLPNLVRDIAISVGDTLISSKHTPGGAQLTTHANNPTVFTKINSDDWDHVVLQAQSQEPSFPIGQVEADVFPFAKILCDSIRANNQCTRPIFYMTWGRENGDAGNCAVWPPVCTYEGMDSLLNLRYRIMGTDNEAYVSPVGAVWNYLRNNHPEIDLYTGDGSHPSAAGSYVAACTFYSIIFQKDPALTSFDFTLPADQAITIRNAAKIIAFDNLEEWNVGTFDPLANFSFTQDLTTVTFSNNSNYAETFHWDFGDGTTSTEENPTHSYQNNNTYTVQLIVSKCGIMDTLSNEVIVEVVSAEDLNVTPINIFPNPTRSTLNINSIPKNSVITIVDEVGKEWKQFRNQSDNLSLDLSDLSVGLYFIKIQNDMGKLLFTEKLIRK